MLGIRRYTGVAIDLYQGDITRFACDAIVNAANEALAGGGGVDGAIHQAGGPVIREACQKIGACPVGRAVVTTAGNLPACRVIHTVGPIWKGGQHGEAELLHSAYKSSLELADTEKCRHIALPSISTGAYGYPVEEAAQIAMQGVKAALDQGLGLRRVTFVLFSLSDYHVYQEALFAAFPEEA